jgi:hypothetical protein
LTENYATKTFLTVQSTIHVVRYSPHPIINIIQHIETIRKQSLLKLRSAQRDNKRASMHNA